MIAVLLFGLVATAAAAPHFPHHGSRHGAQFPDLSHFNHNDLFAEDVFDTRRFWAQMENEMRLIDETLASFEKRFPTLAGDCGIVGNEYKVTIPLTGFKENEIVVKAKEGFLMVQAVQKMDGGGERTYIDAKTIPTSVNVTGTWTFEEGILKIVFPLKTDAVSLPATEATQVHVTEKPDFKDREEMESSSSENDMDVDVGLRGDLDKTELQLKTNEIPRDRVEATTYAVDLKDEVDFVPVRSNYQL